MKYSYTARYEKIPGGYLGQLIEWPEVVTEGVTLEDCREMLRDAANEMTKACQELGVEPPQGSALFEQLYTEV